MTIETVSEEQLMFRTVIFTMNTLTSFNNLPTAWHHLYWWCLERGKGKKERGKGKKEKKGVGDKTNISFIVKYRICVNGVWLNSNNDFLKKNTEQFSFVRFFFTLSIVRLLNLIYHISHRKYLDNMIRGTVWISNYTRKAIFCKTRCQAIHFHANRNPIF